MNEDQIISISSVREADIEASELGATHYLDDYYPNGGTRFARYYFSEGVEIAHIIFTPDGDILSGDLLVMGWPRQWHDKSNLMVLECPECCQGDMGDDGTCSCYREQD